MTIAAFLGSYLLSSLDYPSQARQRVAIKTLSTLRTTVGKKSMNTSRNSAARQASDPPRHLRFFPPHSRAGGEAEERPGPISQEIFQRLGIPLSRGVFSEFSRHYSERIECK